MAEAIQQLILDTLDKDGVIQDTRTRVLPGYKEPAATPDSQIIILGALNSLSSRDVRLQLFTAFDITHKLLADAHVRDSRDHVPRPYT